MTRNLTAIGPSHSALDALRTMAEGGFSHLPVIDDGNFTVSCRCEISNAWSWRVARRHALHSESGNLDRRLIDVLDFTKPFTFPAEKSVQQACRSMRGRKTRWRVRG